MKIMAIKEVEVVSDVRCDVCEKSCQTDCSNISFGTLSAQWGYGSQHDGEQYEVHLCECCFFQVIANMKEERRGAMMFSEKEYDLERDFGLVSRNLGKVRTSIPRTKNENFSHLISMGYH